MDRNAIEPPKACFGLEQFHGNPYCEGCPHRKECADVMGYTAGMVEVDRALFSFIPPALVPRTDEAVDPDMKNMESVYYFCHEWVFDTRAEGNLNKVKDLILLRCREANTSLKMFFLSNMLGWKQSRAGRFHPKVLTLEHAVYQVKTFSEACQKQFGAFDINGLDRMTGSTVEKQDFETQLLNSEIVAGSWIVNFRLFHSGRLVERFYLEKETMLSPYWLAIEPTYLEQVLLDHVSNPDPACPKVVAARRWNASKLRSKLKKNSRQAVAVFNTRERIMPEAIRRVLGQKGLLPEHFMIKNVPVVNAIKFWIWLGSAIQHYECLSFVDNYSSIYDRQSGRKNQFC